MKYTHSINTQTPISHELGGEWAIEWAQWSARVRQAVRSKRMTEWCERTSERTSKWSSTLRVDFIVFQPIVQCHWSFDRYEEYFIPSILGRQFRWLMGIDWRLIWLIDFCLYFLTMTNEKKDIHSTINQTNVSLNRRMDINYLQAMFLLIKEWALSY